VFIFILVQLMSSKDKIYLEKKEGFKFELETF